MDKLVLFDVNNTLTKDTKDISEYVAESIRNIYGTMVEVELQKYEGMTAQETAEAVLLENGMPKDEIGLKLVRYTEDLFYSYYNVAGHDRQLLLDGAKDIVERLSKENVLMGIATGEPEKLARFRLEKVGLNDFFKFGAYGNEGKGADEIVAKAIEKARAGFAFSGKVAVVSCYPNFMSAAKKSGATAIGVKGEKFSADDLSAAGASTVIRSLKEQDSVTKALV